MKHIYFFTVLIFLQNFLAAQVKKPVPPNPKCVEICNSTIHVNVDSVSKRIFKDTVTVKIANENAINVKIDDVEAGKSGLTLPYSMIKSYSSQFGVSKLIIKTKDDKYDLRLENFAASGDEYISVNDLVFDLIITQGENKVTIELMRYTGRDLANFTKMPITIKSDQECYVRIYKAGSTKDFKGVFYASGVQYQSR